MLESWSMKKLLAIVVLGLFLSGNAFANIFNCKIDDTDFAGHKSTLKFVIDVNDFNKSTLTTSRFSEFNYTSDDFILSSEGYNGKIIITSNGFSLREGSYNMFVFENSKKGGNNYFKAIFTEGNFEGLMHTITIKVWENNMPVYLFLSDQPRKVLKGNCE